LNNGKGFYMFGIDLQRCIEGAGYETRSYSGRGMCGKECLGVVIRANVISFIVEIVRHIYNCSPDYIGESIFDQIKSAKTDSMGLDTIVYFTNVEYVEEEGEDDE